MRSDDLGMQLHDRATRGEQLSVEDQARLEAWDAAQDRAEPVFDSLSRRRVEQS
jgi:hypothetical protein